MRYCEHCGSKKNAFFPETISAEEVAHKIQLATNAFNLETMIKQLTKANETFVSMAQHKDVTESIASYLNKNPEELNKFNAAADISLNKMITISQNISSLLAEKRSREGFTSILTRLILNSSRG